MNFIIISHISYILLGPDNKMSKMKKIISEANNENEFYTKKLKRFVIFTLVKPIRCLFWFVANELGFYYRMNSHHRLHL
jgi:hypothetical protein